MKKLFVGIAAGVLAAAMCLSFAACGGSEVNAKGVKGEQVTKEEWDAALELLQEKDTDLTVEYLEEEVYSMKADGKKGGSEETERWTCVKKGTVIYVSGYVEEKLTGETKKAYEAQGRPSSDKSEIEMYTEITDTGIYNYMKDDDGTWTKEQGSMYDSALSEIMGYIEPLIDSYDEYEFSEEYKGYVKKDAQVDEGCTPWVYKFQDKKLAAIYQADDQSQSSGGVSMSREYSLNIVCKYEAKELTLPTVEE